MTKKKDRPKRGKKPPAQYKPFSIRFTSDGLDYEAAGIERPEPAKPKRGETQEDALCRVLERMEISFMRCVAFAHEYVKHPDGETAKIVDAALSGDARARAKLRGKPPKRGKK